MIYGSAARVGNIVLSSFYTMPHHVDLTYLVSYNFHIVLLKLYLNSFVLPEWCIADNNKEAVKTSLP